MRRLALAVLVVFAAGCVGGESDPLRASGSPAAVDPGVAADAGFERVGLANRTLNETVTVTIQGDIEGRESRDVVATVPVTTYRRGGDPPTVLAVASSPRVQVIENPPQSADPLAEPSTGRLVAFVQSTYRDLTNVREVGERTVPALGGEATVVTYAGTASVDGETVDVRVRVARVAHEGDVVTVVLVHPAGRADGDRLAALLRGIDHPQ